MCGILPAQNATDQQYAYVLLVCVVFRPIRRSPLKLAVNWYIYVSFFDASSLLLFLFRHFFCDGHTRILLAMRVGYLATTKKWHDEVKELFTNNRQPFGYSCPAAATISQDLKQLNVRLTAEKVTAGRQFLVEYHELGLHTPGNAGKPYHLVLV